MELYTITDFTHKPLLIVKFSELLGYDGVKGSVVVHLKCKFGLKIEIPFQVSGEVKLEWYGRKDTI